MAGRLAKRRLLARRQATLVPVDHQRVERVLAAARSFLAFAALVAVYIDPSQPSRYAGLAYGLLTVYGIHSLLVLVLVGARAESTPGFRFTVHAADVLFPAVISWFTTGPNSPFFLFNLFTLLAAAYRWGFLETLGTAGAAIILFFTQGTVFASGLPSLRVFLGERSKLTTLSSVAFIC